MDAILDEFDEYLALQRGRSAHTRRAYLGDLRLLFEFLAQRAPDAGLAALSLPMLRSWLAAQASAGAARSTLARRTSAVKTFTAWASRKARGAVPDSYSPLAPDRPNITSTARTAHSTA